MASFTLDDIRAAAEARYGSTDIELGDGRHCRLLNPLRLAKERRSELMALQGQLDSEDSDQEALLAHAIRLVAEHEHMADELLGHIGGDLTVLAQVFETYGKETQVGEASASAS